MIGRESISLGSLGTLQAMSQSPDTNYSRPKFSWLSLFSSSSVRCCLLISSFVIKRSQAALGCASGGFQFGGLVKSACSR